MPQLSELQVRSVPIKIKFQKSRGQLSGSTLYPGSVWGEETGSVWMRLGGASVGGTIVNWQDSSKDIYSVFLFLKDNMTP